MERRAISLVFVCAVIGLLSGQSAAFFKDFPTCMKECLATCIVPPWNYVCPASCLAKCIVHPATVPSAQHFCTVGCATSICSKIITKYDPHLDEVESCVDTCSGSCNKNYVRPVKKIEGN